MSFILFLKNLLPNFLEYMFTRLRIVTFTFILLFLGIIVRLFFWQVIRGKDLSRNARLQRESGQKITAPRGNILASDATWMAARSEAWLVYASLPDVRDISKTADSLAPFFIDAENSDPGYKAKLLEEANRLKGLLQRDGVVWVPLKHSVGTGFKNNIQALSLSGIGFEQEETRAYPESSSSAHLLGFVGKNEEGGDLGYFGLEGFYNLTLSGKKGFLAQEFDARGTPILLSDKNEVSAIGGVDLLTHIVKPIQLNLEKELKEGIEKYGAVGGTAIVLNPKNGGVLAMASYPSYDPAKYFDYGDVFFKNPAVSDIFEPGSIFKVVVMAAALDADAVEIDTKCDICDKPLKVDKYEIETWNNEYSPDSTMLEVIVNSDNVGMAFVGQKLGADKLYDYLSSFGFGEKTGVDLQGEVSGKLRKKGTWNVVDLATASFGQGISATPIQIVSAVSAIANGGKLFAPQVVDELWGESWKEDIKESLIGEVISKESAEEITQMMVEAAKNGESKWTYKRGFGVAGKTGTAQIPIAGYYDKEKTIASFVGFAPYDDPEFVMLVTLREPQTSPWASETAAPLWYSIAEDLFIHFGIQPEK